MSAAALTVVARLYEAYNRHDAAAAAALYSEAGAHGEVAQGRERVGRGEIESGLAQFLESFPDAHWQVERRIGSGGEVAIAYRLTGTLQVRLGPFEPHRQRLELRGVHLVEVLDGEIVRCDDYWDAATFGRQMSATS